MKNLSHHANALLGKWHATSQDFFYGNIIEFCPLTGKLVLPDRVATRPEVLSKPLLNFKVKLADYPSSLCTYSFSIPSRPLS